MTIDSTEAEILLVRVGITHIYISAHTYIYEIYIMYYI